MSVDLHDFTEAACAELGVPRADVDVTMILDMARDVAHNTDADVPLRRRSSGSSGYRR